MRAQLTAFGGAGSLARGQCTRGRCTRAVSHTHVLTRLADVLRRDVMLSDRTQLRCNRTATVTGCRSQKTSFLVEGGCTVREILAACGVILAVYLPMGVIRGSVASPL